jgi:hypothetical protein
MANVVVPAGLVLRWRYFVPSWWWWPPFQQEVTVFAYPGQTVTTDWFEVYYLAVPAPPPPSTPSPVILSPGTPVPPRTETGIGGTLPFAAGWPVAGYRLQYLSGRIVWQCHTLSAPEGGWVTDGVINPHSGDLARAPNPCP